MAKRLCIALSVCLLAACQSTMHVVDRYRIQNTEVDVTKSRLAYVEVRCSGTEKCEFERVDSIRVMSPVSRRFSAEAIQQGMVRVDGSVFSKDYAYYLSLPAQQHEIVIRYYPISDEHAETFHVIHPFKANHHYDFRMFRDRTVRSGSLLKVSAPDPLCVDLLQDSQTIRRFCRPLDIMTGLGEFVEQKL